MAQGLPRIVVAVSICLMLKKYRVSHWDACTAIGPIAAADFLSLFTQMGMDVKHSAGQNASRVTDGLTYAKQLLHASQTMQAPRIKVGGSAPFTEPPPGAPAPGMDALF